MSSYSDCKKIYNKYKKKKVSVITKIFYYIKGLLRIQRYTKDKYICSFGAIKEKQIANALPALKEFVEKYKDYRPERKEEEAKELQLCY